MTQAERDFFEAAKAYTHAREERRLTDKHYRRMRKAWSAMVRAKGLLERTVDAARAVA